MVYVIPSDPLLRLAFYSGLTVSSITLLLILVIAALRYAIDRRNCRLQALRTLWQPVFSHALEGAPFKPPRIRTREQETILLLWINFVESVRGQARQNLQQLGVELQFDRIAQRLLKRRTIRPQMIAMATLGRLASTPHFPELALRADDANSMLSLLAVRSLLQIDPRRGVPIVLRRLEQRDDWPLIKVAAMLREVPADILATHLSTALSTVSPSAAPRLIGLVNVSHIGDTWPMLSPFLATGQPSETMAAALKMCHDPRALDAVRMLAAHEDWVVRAQAAATLGRIGLDSDRLRLQAMLSDPQWWVRYRAATALANLPGMTREKILELGARLDDRFAADMLTQALAETEESRSS
ncbi:MAG TPA: HEAT repeat domain-containing protein [Rhodocyclaceae bacterium]|nr:HEAT repeat domain-containing protein [Rhodocyclaceae bacterium]